tara:strand:- start:4450 stop:5154 length:705 start_codon:yes stop_codon:yes gene_type:complete
MEKESKLTIVSVSDIKIEKTINALIKSNQSLNPYKTILFSSKTISLNKKEAEIIDIIKINKINSIKDYSIFIIYSLYKYIKTSHILIVQWDGYIINPKKWDPKFLNYDYIGAPFIPRENDKDYSRDQDGAFFTIGNGGFSLRSKRLLEAPIKFKLKDNKKYTNFNEDGFFSVLHRQFLESKGLSWAPFDISKEFSIESPLSIQELIDLPLGFHGKKMYYLLMLINLIKILNFRN